MPFEVSAVITLSTTCFGVRPASGAGPLAIDVQLEPRIVEILWNQDVTHAANASQLCGDFACHVVAPLQVVRAHLNVNRRGQSLTFTTESTSPPAVK